MTYQSEVLADSPLVYWRLGETSGTTATDASGNGMHGTYANSPTLGVTSLLVSDASNKAATFTSTAVVSVADTTNLTAFTVECWYKGTGTPNVHLADRALTTGGTGASLFTLTSPGTGDAWGVVNTLTGSATVQTGTTVNDGSAHHIVLTFVAGAGSNNVKIYLDGVLKQSGTAGGTMDTADMPFRAGNNWGGFRPCTGVLDEVAYYTTALSAARILAHFNAGASVPTQTITPAHIASTSVVFAPTIAPGEVAITPAHIASTSQVFAPTITGGNSLGRDITVTATIDRAEWSARIDDEPWATAEIDRADWTTRIEAT